MKLRPTSFNDAGTLCDWIARDPEHAGKTDPDFFSLPRPEAANFTVTDDDGRPLLFVTLEKVARGHVQFCPDSTRGQNAETLGFLAAFLEQTLPKIAVREFITESKFPPLIHFLERALGMRRMESDYHVVLGDASEAGPGI